MPLGEPVELNSFSVSTMKTTTTTTTSSCSPLRRPTDRYFDFGLDLGADQLNSKSRATTCKFEFKIKTIQFAPFSPTTSRSVGPSISLSLSLLLRLLVPFRSTTTTSGSLWHARRTGSNPNHYIHPPGSLEEYKYICFKDEPWRDLLAINLEPANLAPRPAHFRPLVGCSRTPSSRCQSRRT